MSFKNSVKFWIFLADGDLKIAKDELNTKKPFTNAICFHSHQCTEKYLKAYLTFVRKPFRKTHDLAELIELCKEDDKEFEKLYEINAHKLTRYAVQVRYPDDFYIPTIEDAKEAIRIAQKVKRFIRKKLREKGFKI